MAGLSLALKQLWRYDSALRSRHCMFLGLCGGFAKECRFFGVRKVGYFEK